MKTILNKIKQFFSNRYVTYTLSVCAIILLLLSYIYLWVLQTGWMLIGHLALGYLLGMISTELYKIEMENALDE